MRVGDGVGGKMKRSDGERRGKSDQGEKEQKRFEKEPRVRLERGVGGGQRKRRERK